MPTIKSTHLFYGRDFEIDTRNKWEQGQVVVVKRKGMPKELEKSMLFVPFIGAHQAVNAAVAAMALTILMKEDGRINEMIFVKDWRGPDGRAVLKSITQGGKQLS